jgi:hypothetical protein
MNCNEAETLIAAYAVSCATCWQMGLRANNAAAYFCAPRSRGYFQ